MASEGNVTKNQVLNTEVFTKYRSHTLTRYEKTTSDQEKVDGLWVKRGSSDYQGKIWTAGTRAIALFTKARNYLPEVNGESDNAYQQDGEALSAVQGSGFHAWVPLIDGSSVTIGDEVEPATGGKTQKRTTGQKVGIALETVSASGSDENLRIEVSLDDTKLTVTETVTVTTHVGTLANTNPSQILMVTATTATSTGGKVQISTGTAAAGEVLVDLSAGTLTFNTTDAVTEAEVVYIY
jgi:hypothetical protein